MDVHGLTRTTPPAVHPPEAAVGAPAAPARDGLSTLFGGESSGAPATTTGTTPGTTSRASRRALAVTIALGAAVVVALLVLHLAGVRSYVVRTASMGTAAPVGTLVVTSPVTVDELRVGDIVTFRPPERDATTFTHRVVDVTAAGASTRGDASQANDPWLIGDRDIVGRADLVLPGVGWIARALPLLALGGGVVWALTLLVTSRPHRSALRVVGATLVVAVTSALLKPFIAATVLATQSAENGDGGTATVVSTGLIPVRLTTPEGVSTVLTSGQVGELALTASSEGGTGSLITMAPHLDVAGWVVFTLVSCLPLIWCLTVGLTPHHAPSGRRAAGS